MKRFIVPMMIGASIATGAVANEDVAAQLAEMKKQIAELKAAQAAIDVDALKRQIAEVKAHDAGDNIKFDIDYQTNYDMIDYKLQDGSSVDNSAIWSHKLTLGMGAQPLNNLVFKGALSMNKLFGNNTSAGVNAFQNYDWYSNTQPSDNIVRVKEAYFLYFGEMGDVPYTASFGRRPSVDGFMTNLRADNPHPASPVGHNISMEFDGASFKFDMEKVTDISGLYFKICLGRGNSDSDARYPSFTGYMGSNLTMMDMMQAQTPYANSDFDSPDMDLAGLLVQLYDDGQYKVMANYFQGWNMMGANFTRTSAGSVTVAEPTMAYLNDDTFAVNMTDVGDMSGGSLSLQVNGIGNEISDFLDDSVFFASYAFMKTDPKGTHATFNSIVANDFLAPSDQVTEMLGSADSENGYSYYVGLNVPGFMENDRIGFEYNHGSKYWRSFTYGEDTLVGSKLATRGDAYEVYYTLPLLAKNLTAQLRYTYIDYDYTGSDMFFGSTGTPLSMAEAAAQGMNPVESAQNLRLTLRYRY